MKTLAIFFPANIMGTRIVWQAVLMGEPNSPAVGQVNARWDFKMDTEKAYSRMSEANRIIEDFSLGQYALYSLLFLAEIAACFVVVYAIRG